MKRSKLLFLFLMAAIALGIVLIPSLQVPDPLRRIAVLLFVSSAVIFVYYLTRRHAVPVNSVFRTAEAPAYASSVRFSDVAANSEALSSLRELVDYLKYPEKYLRMGARMPRGILLYGPPGTGKTLLARALAGEAGVPLYPLSGSDFVEMYAGVGAGRVRELFRKARRAGKCVVFIDEIDSLGKARTDSSSDEREQTLNALLSEMSGFRDEDGVIVLAATNRPDTLDPALTRPGRFDRQIEVGLPERNERLEILRLHTGNKPLAASIDLSELAADTVRFSGASLECLLNDAALRAARRNASCIEQNDLDEAFISLVAGSDRPASGREQDVRSVAIHEAGHAIASMLLIPESTISRISILPSSRGTAGYNLTVPAEKTIVSRRDLTARIQVLLAGRAAELLVNGTENGLTSGASGDLSGAAELAAAMVMDLGMADEVYLSIRALRKAADADSAATADRCRMILETQFNAVTALLRAHSAELTTLTEELLRKESLGRREIASLLPDIAPSRQPSTPTESCTA